MGTYSQSIRHNNARIDGDLHGQLRTNRTLLLWRMQHYSRGSVCYLPGLKGNAEVNTREFWCVYEDVFDLESIGRWGTPWVDSVLSTHPPPSLAGWEQLRTA